MSLETKTSNLDTKTTDSIERSVKLQDQFHKIVKQLWLYLILASKWILLIFPYLLHPFRQVPISWVGDADSTTSSTTASLLPITLWVHRQFFLDFLWSGWLGLLLCMSSSSGTIPTMACSLLKLPFLESARSAAPSTDNLSSPPGGSLSTVTSKEHSLLQGKKKK